MKASDFIVEYLIDKGITDVFGYPGGMVTHLMDSFSKYDKEIKAHVMYHEQGASFAACGYAQASGKVGVAYATSGPGATNLLTGICNAYFDSIPTLFITGQVNTYEAKGDIGVRQRGFQETDIVAMASSVTKYAVKVEDPNKIKWYLDYAFSVAQSGRKGPVLLDIPMNVFRAELDDKIMHSYSDECKKTNTNLFETIKKLEEKIRFAKRPVLLLGNGIKIAGQVEQVRELVRCCGIPTVSTMLGVDIISDRSLNYGFIGAYGDRMANFAVAKSDLVIALGARLDVRQVGAKRENFAPNADIIRVDIDSGELEYKVHQNEISICADISDVIDIIKQIITENKIDYTEWINVCDILKEKLENIDRRVPNCIMERLGEMIPNNVIITTDVGQNQVWVAQSVKIKDNQRVLFSGGHGAMGYSLPAAIGCSMLSENLVVSFNGDGGFQMNIQELQTIVRDKLPIKIVVINNMALGMIRHFQEMYFDNNYYQTVPQGGYTVPSFEKIAKAYGLKYMSVESEKDLDTNIFNEKEACLIEVKIKEKTYVFPKLEFGKPNEDQEPLIERSLYDYLKEL